MNPFLLPEMMMRNYSFGVFFFLLEASQLVWAGETNPFETIDRHALNAPAEAEKSIPGLVKYLITPAKNDLEKARALYRWETDRISYDVKGFLSGDYGDVTSPAVFTNRQGVCEGFANLFLSLGQTAGLQVVKIQGYCKGYGYSPEEKLVPNHAWNAVKLDGKWQLVDPTWGAGYFNGDKFIKRPTDFYFLTPPDELIFSHFPVDPRWQLLQPSMTLQDFARQPKVDPTFFELGISAREIREKSREKSFRELVETFNLPKAIVRRQQAPLDKYLRAGTEYTFRFEAEGCESMALFNGKNFQRFQKEGSVFQATISPQKGILQVGCKAPDKKNYYRFFLQYVVE